MVKERLEGPIRQALRRSLVLAILLMTPAATPSRAETPPIRLTDATQSGVFNVGTGQAVVGRVAGPDEGQEALKLDFTLPRGTAAGVWAKAFPAGLDAKGIDVVEMAAKISPAEAARQVEAVLEIKGAAGTQRIPLVLGPDWARSEHPVEWSKVGEIGEVVVAVSRTGDAEVANGSIALAIRFEPLPWLRKLGESPIARIGGVILASTLAALLAFLLGMGLRSVPKAEGALRDLVQGVGTVLIVGLGIAVFDLGGKGAESGWASMGLALAGAGVAAWWSVGLTGRMLTPLEAFRDALATGLFAASASPLAILQAPGSWADLLLLSQFVGGVGVVIYQAANAARLAISGRHLGPISGGLIVGTPYAIGSLVLLSTVGLVRELGGFLTFGSLADWPEVLGFLGRSAVLFGFNEVVALGLGLATKRTALRSIRGHLGLLAVAVAAAGAPHLADYGSGELVASLGPWGRWIAAVVMTAFSQAGLWAEVYLITGLLMDAIRGGAPTRASALGNPWLGAKKGVVYAGTFMAILYGLGALSTVPGLWALAQRFTVLSAVLFGALAFPMIKTIFETFDGSQGFFRRVARSYANPLLYARGAVVGLGLGLGIALEVSAWSIGGRSAFGFGFGFAAFAGVDWLADTFEASRGRGRVQTPRYYAVQGLLGGFIGAAIGFYFDAAQVQVVVAKFHRYLAVNTAAEHFDARPLLSKWGYIDLGTQTGGVKLLFDEALRGVISWAVPAWLFAINRTFLAAFLQRESTPIRALFSRAGMVSLTENMIQVFRWGLWMAPIIESFLRPMGDPTWYNQDGAIRTVFATYHDLTSTPGAFRAWSLQVFTYLLAYDLIRVLIWVDHMGLRVATLVNLSFLGMDRLDSRLARFLAPAATARCIPEGVKRFTTWAPLLIPFYIPRGTDWDDAWSKSQAIQRDEAGLMATVAALPTLQQVLILIGSVLAFTALFSIVRLIGTRMGPKGPTRWSIRNTGYEVGLDSTGQVVAQSLAKGYDVSRRSYDGLDPAGRALFVVDESGSWPVVGNFPGGRAGVPSFGRVDDALTIHRETDGLRASVEIKVAGLDDPAEVWEVTVENSSDSPRPIHVVPYLEWVLNKPDSDRGHTQYNRLFAEMEYASGLHAVLAWDKHARAMGVLASSIKPEGFLTSRVDFIGRARSLRSPRALETLAFSGHQDTDAHPTFDPIGSLLLPMVVPARGSSKVRLLIGLVADKARAVELVAKYLTIPGAESHPTDRRRKERHSIGHGEIPPGTPLPYVEFSDDGRTMRVRTPFTPRPFDHTMSNALGHVVNVTNRGLQTTSSVNAQQNRITPDWSDIVTREVPPEAFYLYDVDAKEWFSPTYQPLNDPSATCEVDYAVDGTAVYHMSKGEIETELTIFVPPDEPAGLYLLKVTNHGPSPRRMRVASYFQIVLANQPEYSGPLEVDYDPKTHAVFYENPRNTFRTGPAFVAMSPRFEHSVKLRGWFFGPGRDVARPNFVESGHHSSDQPEDDRPIAGFLSKIEVPAHGESSIVVVLGQADDRARAEAVIRKYANVKSASVSLDETRRWWLDLMDTVRVQTDHPEFDHYLDWLKYQALAERIWARRGFYQASGAFGFRDQLQDSVNLLWMDPALARKQIILHASQQFLEGDVVHWFHRLQDGRTGFAARTHASDNLLWLCWGVVDYVGATGDLTLLDERTPYLESELPFPPLPEGKAGMGFDPLRSTREDTIYRHCLRAIDLVLDRRMGAHGLPLMGTGDWNDGLDEIGSEGRGESVWLGFFLYYILERMAPIVGKREGDARQDHYLERLRNLGEALESTWRDDRYLRAINDDGIEIGVKDSGIWEIDALTAAWAVMAGINPGRGRTVFETALRVLEKEDTILLGWPPLREDTKPYLGRSSSYPEGVRENGMYCHGVQWLVGAARILADQAASQGRMDEAQRYREAAYRLWKKIAAIGHSGPDQIEIYGGQPNQQAADMVTTFDPGRMIWNGYTGAAGWMFRQAIEGVLGYRLVEGRVVPPTQPEAAAELGEVRVERDVSVSPLPNPIATTHEHAMTPSPSGRG
ncbi:GH36-type glycosyl hydrolase domain-containing protein [Tundrisphaera lichenicola]|uniref:GH36-type glycosyl hydrolase domain-containing protein n=1 Tax=Tundrisphaera lichenicola TaxID=2029860 RepID=UPI003EB85E41